MHDAVPPQVAREYLKDVSPLWRAYWFTMHSMAKNLEEFAAGLREISDDVFAFHVSGQKNDLARWTREVIGDAELAAALDHVASKEDAQRVVDARVQELREAARG